MSYCPTINISPYNIVGDGDDISFNGSSELIADVKNMYGVDLTNKKLLAHLKKFGSIKIVSSITRSMLDSCQTEELLDAKELEELAAAKAGMAIAEAELGEQNKYAKIHGMKAN